MVPKAVSIKLAEILNVRISHDLINAISPASNGLDLLKDSFISQERLEIEDLITNSIKRTLNLLIIIRNAISNSEQIIEYTAESYQKLLNQFLNDISISKCYEDIEIYFLKRDIKDAKPRCLLILLLCIRECLVQKSHITINFSNNKFDLIIKGTRLIMRQEIVDSLNHLIPETTVTPQTIFCYLLQQYTLEGNIKLEIINFQSQILHMQLIDR